MLAIHIQKLVEYSKFRHPLSTTISRFKATGNIQSAPRRGRSAKIDNRTQHRVVREIEVQPNHPWKHYASNFDVAPSTIAQAAASDGLHKRKALEKPFLTPANVLKRLEWARNNSQTDWRGLMFTDEAAVESGQRKGTVRTIRRVGEEFEEKYLVLTFRQDRKTLIVWSAVAYGKKGPLKRLIHHPAFDLGKGKVWVN